MILHQGSHQKPWRNKVTIMSEKYKGVEPGISHPFLNTAIRFLNDGRVALLAGDNCGIILDSNSGHITIYGTEVNFAAGDIKIDGLLINKELILDKRIREWEITEYGANISSKIREIE